MRMILVFVILALLYIIFSSMYRKVHQERLLKELQSLDFEAFDKDIRSTFTKLFFPLYMVEFMKLRFSGVPSIEIAPFSDVAVQNICGVNVMFEHGGDANLQTTIEYFSNLYNIDVDEIYAGHLHRPESKAVGITDVGDRMIYRIGSICGVDTFAKQIRKAARPSAYFALYDDDCGHTWSRTYYL